MKPVSDAILEKYKPYNQVCLYIDKWHVVDEDWNNHWENFQNFKKTKWKYRFIKNFTLNGW